LVFIGYLLELSFEKEKRANETRNKLTKMNRLSQNDPQAKPKRTTGQARANLALDNILGRLYNAANLISTPLGM